MKIVQIVLDQSLLDATDRAARRMKRNRSELVREALQEHLKRLEVQLREERDRAGYLKRPQTEDELSIWDGEAVWPAE
jgi:metal-responsive CopG/Arc/MetJ family transcriptional regulator